MPCIYMVASGRHGAPHRGMTANLLARLQQHCSGTIEGFTSRYGAARLVHFELAVTMDGDWDAKRLRDRKVNLIERENPD